MNFDWQFAWEIMPELLRGLVVTVKATIIGTLLAAVLGLIWAMARRSKHRTICWPVASIVEFIRSTPVLVQIYFLFYVLPEFGISMTPLLTGIIALGIHYSGFMSEVYRAGIEGVDRGQWEAATALNLNRRQTWFKVILPQAIPPIIPALGNYFVAMFKDTPMLSAITVLELLQSSKIIGSETFRYLEPLTMAGIFFLVCSLLAASFIRWSERKLHVHGARP
ncbi:MAG: ectoine/hydroxyectoine ABC transporter permease subunit EhuD [Candidatus Hydrogenedentota bacterium]